MPTENLPESAARFVPHRPPILMLHKLTACNGESAEGIAWIPHVSPFHTQGLLPRAFFVELLTQLIAAAQGYRGAGAETPPAGYLVGIDEFDCYKDAHAGDFLHLNIRRMNQVEGFNISEGKITRGDELLAFGELRCFLVSSSALPPPTYIVPQYFESGRNTLGEVIGGCMEIVSVNAAAGKAEADVRFVADAPMFAGHFPDRPIVPGVVWLEAGLVLATTLLSQQIRLRKIVSARFKKPIGPDYPVRMELNVRSQNKDVVMSSRISAGKALVAAFELSLECI